MARARNGRLGTLARIAREIRCDVAAARERDPAARGVSSLEILLNWPGVHALLAHRHERPVASTVVLLRRSADGPALTGRFELRGPQGETTITI